MQGSSLHDASVGIGRIQLLGIVQVGVQMIDKGFDRRNGAWVS